MRESVDGAPVCEAVARFDGHKVVLKVTKDDDAGQPPPLAWFSGTGLDRERMLADLADERIPVENGQRLCFREILEQWDKGEPLYIKDYHAFGKPPLGRRFPLIEDDDDDDDWLNPYLLARDRDDFRFVYAGPKGSGTALHTDVRATFSTSWSLVGWKLWTFLPRRWVEERHDALERMTVQHTNERVIIASSTPSARSVLAEWPDLTRGWEVLARNGDLHHSYQTLDGETIQLILQPPSSKIYVPSLQPHFVQNLGNLDETKGDLFNQVVLSINHNWINHANIYLVFTSLWREAKAVDEELSHLSAEMSQEDYIDAKEKILKANVGWGFDDFWDFVLFTLQVRSLPASESAGIVSCINHWRMHRHDQLVPNVESHIEACLHLMGQSQA